MMKKISVRTLSQILVLGLLLFLTISHMRLGIEKAAPIDAYCPFGAIESFWTYVSTGQYLQRIYTSSFILFGIVIILTIVFGRVFCSHLCPLGALQEWIRKIGRKIGIKKDFELPKIIDKYARFIKYLILILIVYFSFKTGELVFRAYDPYNALMHLGEEFDEKVFGYSVLIVVLIASLFSKNIWCRYFCPLGAGLGILRKLSPFKIERSEKTCISCGTCDRVCPANLDVSSSKEVNSADCISCLECVKDCPKSSLSAKSFGKSIDKRKMSIFVSLSFFIVLGILTLNPIWQTKAPSNLVGKTGELNAENLRGSNTLQYVIETTKIPFDVFQKELNLPENVDKTLKLKDIGPKYNIKNKEGLPIETEDFREVIRKFSK